VLLLIDVVHSEEFMKEVFHQTKDTPLVQRHPPKEFVEPSGKSPLVILGFARDKLSRFLRRLESYLIEVSNDQYLKMVISYHQTM